MNDALLWRGQLLLALLLMVSCLPGGPVKKNLDAWDTLHGELVPPSLRGRCIRDKADLAQVSIGQAMMQLRPEHPRTQQFLASPQTQRIFREYTEGEASYCMGRYGAEAEPELLCDYFAAEHPASSPTATAGEDWLMSELGIFGHCAEAGFFTRNYR